MPSCITEGKRGCEVCSDSSEVHRCQKLYMKYKHTCGQAKQCHHLLSETSTLDQCNNQYKRATLHFSGLRYCIDQRRDHSNGCISAMCRDKGHQWWVENLIRMMKNCLKVVIRTQEHLETYLSQHPASSNDWYRLKENISRWIRRNESIIESY